MKILFLITGLSIGGAEKIVVNSADIIASQNHEVLIAFIGGTAEVLPKDSRVKVVSLDVINKIDILSAFLKLRKLILYFQPDVLHTHMFHANILGRLVRLVTYVPFLISSAHNSTERSNLRMMSYRLTDALADISTNVSEEAVACFIKAKAVKTGRMIAMYNGIDVNHFIFNLNARIKVRKNLFIDEHCRLILAVGRLHEQKDYPNLFNALAKLSDYSLNFQLCIAGEGLIKENLKTLVTQLGLSDRVQFLGIRNDIPELMSAADVFVLSSAWEGFGLVVAEAMACERVVVATDSGGVREVLGDAGYLVRPQDHSALSEALLNALKLSAIESSVIGLAARNRVVEKFSLGKIVEKWIHLYESNKQ
jgi:glycosyltransferase involved in cell wall biosynthesis